MNETHYLVDNNALISIGAERSRSQFFARWCHLTSDVLDEAEEHPFRQQLEVVPRTATMFERLREVMKTEPAGDISLVDLYKNKGSADPGLVATILEMQSLDLGAFSGHLEARLERQRGAAKGAGIRH